MKIGLLPLLFILTMASGLNAEVLRDSLPRPKPPVDVDFLFNYYEQDGDNSAVTGGKGTEELSDYSTTVIINVPTDSLKTFNAQASFNIYSSASTDMIDNRMSSASSQDFHISMQFGLMQESPDRRFNRGWFAGGSIESDYLSVWLGGNWGIQSRDQNRSLSVTAKAYFDRWILYFPAELRDTIQTTIQTDKRRSYHLGLQYNQVADKRTQFAITAEGVLQEGLLSTPFHRVYFQGEERARIEKLPGRRWKIPLAIQVNHFATDFLIFRLYYRYYWDNFNIQSHTLSAEIPLKVSRKWTIIPVYRYYTQQGSSYFRPFGEHTAEETFYTSDFDLSSFDSHKLGIGIRYQPLLLVKKRGGKPGFAFEWDNISLRFAHYQRSNGLRAFIVSTFAGFKF